MLYLEKDEICLVLDKIEDVDQKCTWELDEAKIYFLQTTFGVMHCKYLVEDDFAKYIVTTLITEKNIYYKIVSNADAQIKTDIRGYIEIGEGIDVNAYNKLTEKGFAAYIKNYRVTRENGYYILKMKHDPEEHEMQSLAECSICYQENKLMRKLKYFVCSHTMICHDCYLQLRTPCCPYCRAELNPC